MAKSVKWNKKALDTFYKTALFLENEFSKTAADNYVRSIMDKIEVLRKYPTLGRKVKNRKTIRFVLIGKHRRLYYRVQGKQLIIASLFDTRQNPLEDSHQ